MSFFHTANPVYTSRLHVSIGLYTLWQRQSKIKGVCVSVCARVCACEIRIKTEKPKTF